MRKKKMSQQFLAMLLSCIMLLSILPSNFTIAYAETQSGPNCKFRPIGVRLSLETV